MKTIKLIAFFTLLFCLNGLSQSNLPITFRVEKQAMSTPMSPLEEMFFMKYYHTRPVNIKFDGSLLNMSYDNGATFTRKNVTAVDRFTEIEDNRIAMETILYIDNTSDALIFKIFV